jgi:hypothetical protein
VNNISVNPGFLTSIEALMNMVRYSCMLVVPSFVLIQLIVSLARGFTWADGVRVDYAAVVKGFILLVSLFFYAEVMGLISGAIGGFAGFIVQPDNIYQNLDILGSGVPQQPPPAEEGVAGYIDQAVEWIGSFNLHYWLQSLVVGGVASVARKLIEVFRQSLLGFLYVVGPIALSLSALPGFGGLLRKWFQNYFSVQCWSITLIILDNLVDLYTTISQARTSAMTGGSLPEASEKIDILLITIVITLLYFMVPYLTSLFVGQTSSAMFNSKMISLGTAAATLGGRGGMVAGKAALGAVGLGATGVVAGAILAGKGIGKAFTGMREATDSGGSNASGGSGSSGKASEGRPPAGNQSIPVRKA